MSGHFYRWPMHATNFSFPPPRFHPLTGCNAATITCYPLQITYYEPLALPGFQSDAIHQPIHSPQGRIQRSRQPHLAPLGSNKDKYATKVVEMEQKMTEYIFSSRMAWLSSKMIPLPWQRASLPMGVPKVSRHIPHLLAACE